MISSRGQVSSLDQRTFCSRLYKPGSRKGVLCFYGDTGTRDSWVALDAAFWPSGDLNPIVEAGFPMASIDTGVLWGNSTMRTNISQLKTNVQTALFASGKVHLMGVSAGGLAALNWAKNNTSLVQSLTLLIPVVDVQDTYDNNRGGFQSEINTAYGARPADADNPAKNYASFTGFPINYYYSTTDTVTTTASVTAFASGVGSNVTLTSMGAIGHAWGAPWTGAAGARFIAAND